MTAEKVLQSLIEEELQKQGARVRQRQYETGQPAAGLTHPDFPEVRPVGLGFLTGKAS